MLHRPFFALRPPPVVARRIAAAAEVLGHRLLPPERLHITLFILDDRLDLPPALVMALRGVGAGVALAPFAVTLDRLVGSRRSVALRPGGRDAGLAALHDRLAALARAAGIPPRDGWRFSPHVTLGYRDAPPSSERVAPVGWTADELVLVDSHVGATRHAPLGRSAAGRGGRRAAFAAVSARLSPPRCAAFSRPASSSTRPRSSSTMAASPPMPRCRRGRR